MTMIRNDTKRPLSVPLPRGKKLHLGPGKTGQIAATAVEHPPIQKLIEAGDIQVLGEEQKFTDFIGSGTRPRPSSQGGRSPGNTGRSSGDR